MLYSAGMSAGQIFFAIFGTCFACASFVMALARTRPKDAGSSLAEWLALIGISAPNWLRNPSADMTAQVWAGRIVAVSILGAILSGAVWAFAPFDKTIPVAGEAVYGELRPANDATPPNGCDGKPFAVNSVKVLIGDNAIGTPAFGEYSILGIGTCKAISFKLTTDGVLFNAQLYDRDDNRVIRIEHNKIDALSGEDYSVRQSIDKASVIVTNKRGVELFYARFMNKDTLRVRGFFGCVGQRQILVQDDQPIPGFFLSHSCILGGAEEIQVGN